MKKNYYFLKNLFLLPSLSFIIHFLINFFSSSEINTLNMVGYHDKIFGR